MTTDEFKKQLTILLHKYNEDQGHIVTNINLEAVRNDTHIKKALYYNVEMTVE